MYSVGLKSVRCKIVVRKQLKFPDIITVPWQGLLLFKTDFFPSIFQFINTQIEQLYLFTSHLNARSTRLLRKTQFPWLKTENTICLQE